MSPEEALMAQLKDPNSPLSKRIIYFDYDSYSIKDSYASLISAHAKILVANPKLKMLIQGMPTNAVRVSTTFRSASAVRKR
jgi:peptidoglycan-associated lipoprotein